MKAAIRPVKQTNLCVRLLHRAVATSKDMFVQQYRDELAKFVQTLGETLRIENFKIEFKRDHKFGVEEVSTPNKCERCTKWQL